MSLQALCLAWLGLVLLCAAMPRHAMDMLPGRKLTVLQKRLLQLAGVVVLLCSGRAAIAVDDVAYGLTGWVGLLTLALVLLSVLLSWRPRWVAGSIFVVSAIGVLV